MKSKYPKGSGTVRPFRLWNASSKKNLAHRCYKIRPNAHIGALIECRWAAVGHTIEVYNVTTGKLLGQYTRTPTAIDFKGE